MNYEQWHKHTTELQNKHGYTGKPPKGPLAEVSIYEFVNDWVRPEISWQILSYVANDPHKEGVKMAQNARRWFYKTRPYLRDERGFAIAPNPKWKGKGKGKWKWEEPHFKPYNKLNLYREINEPFYSDDRRSIASMETWANQYGTTYDNKHLKYTNPLLHELWSFHNFARHGITKNAIIQYLKMNLVKGRTKLTSGDKCNSRNRFGTTWTLNHQHDLFLPPQCRRELVAALMKLE